MIAVFAFTLMLLTAAGCFVGANFCTSGSSAQLSLVGLGAGLVGAVLPSVPKWLQSLTDKNTQSGHARLHTMCSLGLVSFVMIFAVAFSFPMAGCRVKPDVFFETVVDCAKVNPNSSAATSSVMTCLMSALSGNPAACLSGLVTEAHWTVDEVACIVADIAQKENTKVGTALEGPKTRSLRDTAAGWLASERIRIENTYPGEH